MCLPNPHAAQCTGPYIIEPMMPLNTSINPGRYFVRPAINIAGNYGLRPYHYYWPGQLYRYGEALFIEKERCPSTPLSTWHRVRLLCMPTCTQWSRAHKGARVGTVRQAFGTQLPAGMAKRK